MGLRKLQEIHFFHGFLGAPRDWEPVIKSLRRVFQGKIICHDLFQDFKTLACWEAFQGSRSKVCEKGGLGEGANFKAWAELKKRGWEEDSPRLLVGYSLGGRLALHLPPESFSKLLLIGVHPGLQSLSPRQRRAEQDRLWLERSQTLEPQSWMKLWNQQEVFKNDQVRPGRSWNKEEIKQHCQLMEAWSLAKQGDQWSWLVEHKEKLCWVCGARDQKFLPIREKLSSLLGTGQVLSFPGAGHGVPFEAPEALARWILQSL